MTELQALELLMAGWDSMSWYVKLILILFALHPLASLITASTDTPKDEKAWGWFYNHVIRPLALNNAKAQEKPGEKTGDFIADDLAGRDKIQK